MSNQNEESQEISNSKKWEAIKSDLEELEKIYISLRQGKNQTSFEYELIAKAQKIGLEPEQYRKIFKEFYTERRILKNLDNWIEDTSFFSLVQRFTTLVGVTTLVVSAITFLPTQQAQKKNDLVRNQIEQERANYEAWGIVNSNRVDNKGKLIYASSGRITALQNLNKNHVFMQGLEIPEVFLIGINLEGANLYRANFRGSDLYKANFNSIPAQKPNSPHCSWLGWTHALDCKSEDELKERVSDLERISFRGAILYRTQFNNGVKLFRADFRPFYREDSPSNQSLELPNLLPIECFDKRILQCTRAVNAEFKNAELMSADFTKADLRGAKFDKANLHCAIFQGAIFNSIPTEDPNLPDGVLPTSFVGADLTGADFRNLAVPASTDKVRGLSVEQIKKANNWQKALYSPELIKELGLSEQSYKPFFECPQYDK